MLGQLLLDWRQQAHLRRLTDERDRWERGAAAERLSREMVCKKISEDSIDDYENGRTMLAADTLLLLMHVFGRDLSEINSVMAAILMDAYLNSTPFSPAQSDDEHRYFATVSRNSYEDSWPATLDKSAWEEIQRFAQQAAYPSRGEAAQRIWTWRLCQQLQSREARFRSGFGVVWGWCGACAEVARIENLRIAKYKIIGSNGTLLPSPPAREWARSKSKILFVGAVNHTGDFRLQGLMAE